MGLLSLEDKILQLGGHREVIVFGGGKIPSRRTSEVLDVHQTCFFFRSSLFDFIVSFSCKSRAFLERKRYNMIEKENVILILTILTEVINYSELEQSKHTMIKLVRRARRDNRALC